MADCDTCTGGACSKCNAPYILDGGQCKRMWLRKMVPREVCYKRSLHSLFGFSQHPRESTFAAVARVAEETECPLVCAICTVLVLLGLAPPPHAELAHSQSSPAIPILAFTAIVVDTVCTVENCDTCSATSNTTCAKCKPGHYVSKGNCVGMLSWDVNVRSEYRVGLANSPLSLSVLIASLDITHALSQLEEHCAVLSLIHI